MKRRTFLLSGAALAALRAVPVTVPILRQRRVLKLVYDRSVGAMRAIDTLVP